MGWLVSMYLLGMGEAFICSAKFEYSCHLRRNISKHDFAVGSNYSLILYFSSDSYNCTKDVEETKRSDPNHWRGIRNRIGGKRQQ